MLRVTLLFVAGFSTVFVALGFLTARVSTAFRWASLKGVFEGAAAIAILAMGVFVIVAALIASPRLARLLGEKRFQPRLDRLGPAGPLVMGAAFAFGWTPCIGPLLGSILLLAGTPGDEVRAAINLAAYSLGLGVPFVAAGLFLGTLVPVLGWLKRNARTISLVSGALLVVFGLFAITGNTTDMARWFQRVLGQGVDVSADPNLVVSFAFGLLSFASPCVLPLLPGYLSLMSGYSAAELLAGSGSDAVMAPDRDASERSPRP